MNKFKLSAIASSVLLTAAIFTGCGNNAESASALNLSSQAADGYVVELVSDATLICGETTYTTSTVGTAGKLGFTNITAGTDLSTCTQIVPADAIIDVNNNGLSDSADKASGFILKATGDSSYVSHLTTLVVAKKDSGDTAGAAALAALVNTYDPVTAGSTVVNTNTSAAEKIKIQNLIILGEVAKTVLASASETAASKIDTSKFTAATAIITSAEVTSSLSDASLTSVKAAAESKATAMTEVVKVIENLDTDKVDINTVMTSVSDGNTTLTAAINTAKKTGVTLATADAALKTGVTSTIASIDTAVSTANTAVALLPPKLNIGTTIKAGTKEILLNGSSFTTSVSSASFNLSDYFSVSLPGTILSKDVASLNTQTISLSIEIIDKDNTGDTAKLTVAGVKVSLVSANSNKVKVTIPSGSTVTATQTGLTGLSTIADGATVTATTGSALVNSDFSFNINTLVSALGGNTVETAINELNAYFKKANTYTVKITMSGSTDSELVVDNKTIEGTVTVTN